MPAPINYLHSQPPSLPARLLQFGMSLIGWKNKLAEQMKKQHILSNPATLPYSLKKNFSISTVAQNGRKIWSIGQKKQASDTLILYLHGGAYVNNILSFHWNLVGELAQKTKATVVVPDYPLAPQDSYKEVFEFIGILYSNVLKAHPKKQVIFMGDSAGAGLALAFSQHLRDELQQQPDQIILLSPLLDITMSNPEIEAVEAKDKMLAVEGVKLTAEAYAAGLDSRDFRVSPLYGDFHNLGKISLFIGTHDLLYPDSLKLKRMLEEQGIPINYFEYPGMFHVWMAVTFLKEAKQAIRQITSLIG